MAASEEDLRQMCLEFVKSFQDRNFTMVDTMTCLEFLVRTGLRTLDMETREKFADLLVKSIRSTTTQ